MYDIDRPKFLFVSLLEEFIRETEHSLAYFFALLVFLLTFLLALFGKDVLYTGLVGIACLFLIKLRDIIEAFKDISSDKSCFCKEKSFSETAAQAKQTLEEMQNFYTAFDDAAITVIAEEFPNKFSEKKLPPATEKPNLLSYLHTCWKIVETVSTFFPDRPLQPETKRSLKKMTVTAQKYLFHYLQKKFALTKEQIKQIEKNSSAPEFDSFLLQTQLESEGIDEKTAQWTVKVLEILRKIRLYIDVPVHKEEEKTPSPSIPAGPSQEPV